MQAAKPSRTSAAAPMIGLAIAVASALAAGVGFVLQQHAAAEAGGGGPIRFVVRLVRDPIWLAGIAWMVAGQILSAFALDRGGLTTAEPGFATMLLFALPMSAVWRRLRLGWREWLGAIALSAGVAGFVLAARPSGGNAVDLGSGAWAFAGPLGAALLLVIAARHRPASLAATVNGVAAGILFGLQDALTRRALLLLTAGVVAMLQTWSSYALVAVGVLAILVAQRAFASAPVAASLPGVAIGEPVTGIALGAGLYGEHVATSGAPLAFELLSLGAMFVGLFLVARSPLVERATPTSASDADRDPEQPRC